MDIKEEILSTSDKLRNGDITTDEAQIFLLRLFHGTDSLSLDELKNIKYLAHKGLPDECLEVEDWGYDVKFCSYRQGEGNMCQSCSHYE